MNHGLFISIGTSMSAIHSYALSFIGGAMMALSGILFLLLINGRIDGINAWVKRVRWSRDGRIIVAFLVGLIISVVLYRVLFN
jgi:flagellar biosynthesis protein FliQ